MGDPADDSSPQKRQHEPPTEAVILERRRYMAAIAAETGAMMEADRRARAAEESAAWLYLETLSGAHPALAVACKMRQDEMVAAGARDDEVLEALLDVARPYRPGASGWSAPMSMDEAVAMIEKS